MKERKKELRRLIAQEKTRYCDSTLKALSADILANLERHPAFQKANTLLLYHSLKDEVQTHSFIEKWSQKKKIILPVVVGNELELRLYTGTQDLAVGAYGIAEPTGKVFTDYSSIDLAIIPGVAFDKSGHRLGRGKGYYDRLLPYIPATKFGICFPFQLLDEVPAEPFDICMNTIITK
ncbi:5-formyltetrahydrofolate cyclo-ligase [Bacteroides sp.]